MSAPVEEMTWTMPISTMSQITSPIFAIVIAPLNVRKTVQSGSFTIASSVRAPSGIVFPKA